MSNEKNIRIVKGGERFIGSQDKDVRVTPLITTEQREYVEGDRNLSLSLVDQFSDEREYCSRYRPYGKINMVYNNVITGTTGDATVLESMYFMPDYYGCPANNLLPNSGPPCTGVPPSMAFDMVPPKRYWGNTSDYSDVTSHHDNWVSYITYVFAHDDTYSMRYYYGDTYTNGHITFTPADGIPFISEWVILNGSDVLQFRCAVPHGLTKDEYFELQPNAIVTTLHHRTELPSNPLSPPLTPVIDGKPDSFGDGMVGSEEYVFNVRVDATSSTFQPTSMGTFKRIINIDRKNDTRSDYYVHKHKFITKHNDITMDRTGFEDEIFKRSGRIFKTRHTPAPSAKKTVIRQEMNSYLWNCDTDIDREDYYDNHNRPITDLYLTIVQSNTNNIWRYGGAPSSPMGYGWDWNFKPVGDVDPWVSIDNNPTLINQNTSAGINKPTIGSIMRGAFVEWNKYELEERTLSDISHSLEFEGETTAFAGQVGTGKFDDANGIYQYKPHYKIQLRTFSKNILYDSDLNEVPQYAQYLSSESVHRWRMINPIGFYEEGYGITYPYLNDSHYPYIDIRFIIEPIRVGSEFSGTGRVIMIQQSGDDCE